MVCILGLSKTTTTHLYIIAAGIDLYIIAAGIEGEIMNRKIILPIEEMVKYHKSFVITRNDLVAAILPSLEGVPEGATIRVTINVNDEDGYSMEIIDDYFDQLCNGGIKIDACWKKSVEKS
jgi:hypothetical protein